MPDPRHPDSDAHRVEGLAMQHLRLPASRTRSATTRLLHRRTGDLRTVSAGTRRIFVPDAIINGLPPHITQVIR